MIKADLDKQLLITVTNNVGTLAEVAGVISSSGINLFSVNAYTFDDKGIIMFVSENNTLAKKLLQTQKYDVREEEVILITVDNKPGVLQSVTKKIADMGIDLNLIYGSVDKKGKVSRLVVVTEDNKAALAALKTI